MVGGPGSLLRRRAFGHAAEPRARTLCVVDVVPRQLGSKQIETLRILARQAMCQLELNLQAMRDR